MLLSSSGVVTAMLIGLANASLLSLEQVFSVTLGASVGSTFIVQLFSFHTSEYGLYLITIGTLLTALSSSERVYHLAKGIFFLGLMFFSMKLVMESGKALEQNELFQYVVNYFKNRPLVSLFISAAFTALIQSSAATIGFVMSLMVARQGDIYEAIPWILGANLGTTATAFFASFKTGILGKQAVLGNLLFKIFGILIFMPFSLEIGKFIVAISPPEISRQIANTHTFFNLALALIFFPFISLGVKIVRKLITVERENSLFYFRYLDARSLATPELAIAQAQQEILRLSDIVQQMVERSFVLFENFSQKELEAVKEMDQLVDFLNRGIKLFLTKLSQNEMSPEQAQKQFEILIRTNDLENIGDIVDKNILELLKKNVKKGYQFSNEGWAELSTFHQKVMDCYQLSVSYFNHREPSLLGRLKIAHQSLEDLVIEFTEQHMQRLHRGVKQTLESSSVHLDLLSNFKRISDLSINFSKLHTMKVG